MHKEFIIFDEKDMKRLIDDRFVRLPADDDFPEMIFCTEACYQKYLEYQEIDE